MSAIAGNLSVADHPMFYKCLEFAAALTSLNGSEPGVTFKNSRGIEFVKVEGFKHYPILVNQPLFYFISILGTAATVFCCIGALIAILAFFDATIKLCIAARWEREARDRRAEELDVACRRASSRFIVRSTAPHLPSDPQLPTYVESQLAANPTEPKHYVQRFIPDLVYTIDGKFTVQAFEPRDPESKLGINLQIFPLKHRCPDIACTRAICPNLHTFFIHIPCSHTQHPQLELRYPPANIITCAEDDSE